MNEHKINFTDGKRELTAYVNLSLPVEVHDSNGNGIGTREAVYPTDIEVIDCITGEAVPVTDSIRRQLAAILNEENSMPGALPLPIVATQEEAMQSKIELYPTKEELQRYCDEAAENELEEQ